MTLLLAELPASGRVVLALLLAAAGASLAAGSIVLGVRRDRAAHGPAIRTLATDLGLAAGDRRLIVRIARFAEARHAGALLVSRGCYDRAAARYAQRFGASREIAALRRRLFETS